MSSTQPRLPQELYRPIIEAVHAKYDLYALLFVSSNVRGEAERVLYRVLVVDDPDLDRRFQLLHHLINSDYIAALVRSLQIEPAINEDTERYWFTVNQALRAVKNLKRLTVLDDLYHAYPPYCLLSGCNFRLRSLSVQGIFPANQAALELQSELEEFEVPYARGTRFSPQSFPRLSILSNSNFEEATFPNARHTVTRFELTAGVPEHGCPPFYRIKSLSVYLYTSQAVVFSTILTFFPSLRYLQCHIIRSFEPVVDGILEQTTELTHLEKIYLQWSSTAGVIHPGSLDFSTLFSNLPSLHTVALQSPTTEPTCVEWLRDVPGYEHVPSYPDEWKDSCWVDT